MLFNEKNFDSQIKKRRHKYFMDSAYIYTIVFKSGYFPGFQYVPDC